MDRTPGQVIASAANMDRARAAGLPDDLLVTLLNARQSARNDGPWPDPVDLARAVAHPAAQVVDAVLVQAIRRRLQQRGS